MSKQKVDFIAGLEIGSTKVALSISQVSGEKLEVMAVAQAPHKGMHQGQIVDTKEIISALQKIKAETEITANVTLTEVHLTVADLTLETVHSKGSMALKRGVSKKDIAAVLNAAIESAQVRNDREILHSFPQFYKVGSQRFEEPPLKQKGGTLEVSTILVTGNRKNINLAKDCVNALGLSVKSVVAHSIATAEALLQKEDKQLGAAVIDIGGGLTDIAVYKNNTMVLTTALPVGGVTFTQDLAVGLRTPQAAAEKIKKNNGAALIDIVSPDESVEIESLKGEPSRQVPARFICEILEARAEETLGLILKKLNDADLLFNLKNGIYLTGGGSQLPGLPELGEFTFEITLRRGATINVLTTNPLAQGPGMSTVIGLLQYARSGQSFEPSEISMDTFKGSWGKIKNFIENLL